MIPIPRDFRDFIGLLNAKRVKYVIVGGYAVAYHGYPRATGDLAVFKEFGFSSGDLNADFFMEKSQVVRLGREPLKLEILNDISGVSFEECYRHRKRARIGGLAINFIDLPRLIENKTASNRDKDQLDIKNLPTLRTRNPRA